MDKADYTIASPDRDSRAPVVVAQVEHHDIGEPAGTKARRRVAVRRPKPGRDQDHGHDR